MSYLIIFIFIYIFTTDNRSSIAAAVSSMLATMAAFPLDSIKARLQVNTYHSVMDCVKKTYKEEGTKGFYRGIAIPMLTITIVRTLSFTIYDETKRSLHRRNLLSSQSPQDVALSGLLGGMLSGLSISVGSCAFELVKIRAQLESAIAAKQRRPLKDINTWQGAKEIIGSHGFRGLYFGFNLHCLRDTIGTGIYFLGYDSTRSFAEQKIAEAEQRRLSGTDDNGFILPRSVVPFLCGSSCGVISWFLIYPLDVVKSRLQRDALASSLWEPVKTLNILNSSTINDMSRGIHHKRSFGFKAAVEVFRGLIRESNGSLRVLYSGLSISAFRSFFQHGIMWTILERVRDQIQIRFQPD
ncbi:mitochondrial carrier domain-containing protein [Phakopsora pachyrhizi]|uniref:Mitochondrial carrier domain-containing protein n=1 Tax=Phakopsora pachyrhizi TaxID=170000 RepID=A0AAV0BJF5_PHAPC|nr:mitochondrial carrier domain-containing protein [Phakopsora pachyrhizi]